MKWMVLAALALAAPGVAVAQHAGELACAGRIGKSAVSALPTSVSELAGLTSPAAVVAATARIGEAAQSEMRACLDDAYAQGERDGRWASLWMLGLAAGLGAAAGYATGRARRRRVPVYDLKDNVLH